MGWRWRWVWVGRWPPRRGWRSPSRPFRLVFVDRFVVDRFPVGSFVVDRFPVGSFVVDRFLFSLFAIVGGEVVIGSGGGCVDVGLAVEDRTLGWESSPRGCAGCDGPSTSSDSGRNPRPGVVHSSGGARTSAASAADPASTGEAAEDSTALAASQAATGEPATGSTAPTAQANPQQTPVAATDAKDPKATSGKPPRRSWAIPSSAPRTGANSPSGAVGVHRRNRKPRR